MKQGKGRLKGVEINIYQGGDGSWHASVLLDKQHWGGDPQSYGGSDNSHLPARGNRPLVDQGSHRWWYDLTAASTVYRKHHPSLALTGVPQTQEQMIERIRAEIAGLLRELLTDDVSDGKIVTFVNEIPLKHSSRWRVNNPPRHAA